MAARSDASKAPRAKSVRAKPKESRQISDTYRQKLKALKRATPSPNSGAYLGACIV